MSKSTRQLKKEVLRICGELEDGNSPFDSNAVDYLNDLHRGVIAGGNLFGSDVAEPWVWAQSKRPILLALQPKVDTGTVSLVADSAAGTFSSAPVASMEGRFLYISTQADVYRIATHTAGATAFTLDYPYLEATGSYTFLAVKLDYKAIDDNIIINSLNNKIDFNEGGSQLTATLISGTYNPTTLCTEIATRLGASGVQIYTVTFNSITRKFTIAQGGATFVLMFGTGTNVYVSAAGTLGFDQENKSGALTYSSGYALNGVLRITKPLSMYRESEISSEAAKDSNKIFLVDDNTFLREFPISRISEKVPDKFCLVDQDQNALWTLRMNAYPDEEIRVEMNYIPLVKKLIDSDSNFPLVPEPNANFLIYGAAHFLLNDKSDSKADKYLQMAQAQLKALVNDNRKGLSLGGQNFGRIIPRMSQLRRYAGNYR